MAEYLEAEKKQEIEQAVARQFDMRSTKKNQQNTDGNAVHSRKEV